MADYKLGEIEMLFSKLIWENEPLTSGELVKLAQANLSWKKSTTYTILRRLCDRGIFNNDNGIVTSLISKQEFDAVQSEKFVDETFSGSLPQFLTAFSLRKKLSDKDIKEIQDFIDDNRGSL